jgi:DNA polymerase III sliding clamp (beta) subunit (PCNA family)
MQIRVDKLRKNLTLVQPVVPRKPTLPVLSQVCFKEGQLTATDLETTVSLAIPEAQEAAFLLPFKAVMELLKFVPGDEMLSLELTPKLNSKSQLIKLSWRDGSAAYEVKNIRDYPEMAVKKVQAEGYLNGDRLVEALASALPYCATVTTRPVLTGVTLYLGNVLQVAGADGFRLSFQSLNLSYPREERIVLLAATVRILENLWRKEPAPAGLADNLVSQITQTRQLQLSLGDYSQGTKEVPAVPASVRIRFGNITLISKLHQGTPPDHLQALNNFQEPSKVRLMAPELYNAVRRLQGIAKDSTGVVRLQWTDSQMTVSARNEETGEVQAVFPVEPGSNPGRTALNVTYLLDYLNGKEGLIILGKAEGSTPALFHYGARPIVAIMPMNVSWGDEQPAGESKGEAESSEAEDPEEEPEKAGEVEADSAEEVGQQVPESLSQDGSIAVDREMEAAEAPMAAEIATRPADSGEPTEKPKRRSRKKKNPQT